MVLSIIGFMGTGKTYWGGKLATTLELTWYDLDEIIERNYGQSISQLFATYGEARFRMLEREVLENIFSDSTPSDFVLTTGGGTPCYEDNIQFLKRRSTVVWIKSSEDTTLDRLSQGRANRPLISHMSLEELRQFISKKMNDRKVYYEQAHYTFSSETTTLDDFKLLLDS